jgi:signal transduction histidine kinase
MSGQGNGHGDRGGAAHAGAADIAAPAADDGADTLAIAAHELKNALGPLAMTLQLCERQARGGQPVAPADLAFARAQVRKIGRMVNDLLDVGCVEQGRFPLRPAPVDLCELVRSTVDAFRRATPRQVLCELPPSSVVHIADGERIGDVLANFLDNAAKYAPEPSPIEVRLTGNGELTRIAVTDHGPGIEPADQPRLFDRYFRAARTADAARGLGLGLYLCRVIAEGHGGAVGVDSAPGRGSTFWIDLALAPSVPTGGQT